MGYRVMDRLAKFQEFIAKKPNDPFPRYGLAMEYRNAGQLDDAQTQFEMLMEQFPDYLATYFMAGSTLVELGRKEDARLVFERGIEISRRQGNSKTRAELETALAELG